MLVSSDFVRMNISYDKNYIERKCGLVRRRLVETSFNPELIEHVDEVDSESKVKTSKDF